MLKTSGISPFSRKKTSSISRKKHSFLFSKIKCGIESCFSSGKSSPPVSVVMQNGPVNTTFILLLFFLSSAWQNFLELSWKGTYFYLFSEGVISYNIPQGMVRGSTLELLDITYDGVEDQVMKPNQRRHSESALNANLIHFDQH